MIKLPSLKTSYFIAFLSSLALLLFSFYLQTHLGFQPCALCELQRGVLVLLALVFLIGVLSESRFKIGVAFIGCLMSLLGVVLSGRQVWLQHLPFNPNQNCEADLQYMLKVLPFDEVFTRVFQGSAECAQTGWTFLSLSLAAWSLCGFILFLFFSLFQLMRKSDN